MNPILREDFDIVFLDLGKTLEELRDRSILVTGANGMIASYLIKFLSYLNESHQFNMTVSGLVRTKPDYPVLNINYLLGDVCNYEFDEKKFDYIVHAASLASPVHYGTNPIGTSLPNILGTINLLRLAEKCSVKGFLFVSSSEVYGSFNTDKASIEETEFGTLDPMLQRSCYAESKRMGENLCISWFKQKKIPVKIIRPFHTYGPGLKNNDGRIYADLIYSIVDKRDIVLNSKGEAKRAFCYMSDALSGLLLTLIHGGAGEAYNLGNPDQELSIFEAASIATQIFPNRKVGLKINEAVSQGYLVSKVLRNSPSIAKIKDLGWYPRVKVQDGFTRTVKYIEFEGAQ